MLIKPLLNAIQVMKITTTSGSSQVNVLVTCVMIQTSESGHGAMNCSTLVHTVNPLKTNGFCQSPTTC